MARQYLFKLPGEIYAFMCRGEDERENEEKRTRRKIKASQKREKA
jgi:hypothetical protein